MTWFKVDDGFADHPKVLAALEERRGPHAIALWTLAGAWSSKHLRNGFVPTSVVKRLGFGPSESRLLVRVGLWEQVEGGFVFHDWEACNPTKDQVEQKREKSRKKVEDWRKRKDCNPVTTDERNPVTGETCNQTSNPAPVPTRPDPSRPVPTESNSDLSLRPAPAAPSEAAHAKPRRVDEGPAKTTPTWLAYAAAYQRRYETEPVRNAKVSGQLKQFVARVPADEAPAIAAHYLRSDNARYVASGHSIGCLLQDAEKLRTEWATGSRITASSAREADRKQATGDMWGGLIAEARAKQEAANG